MKQSGRKESLAQRVKRLREEKRLSLAAVETNSGGRVTNGYVSRIENGHETNLTRDVIIALAKGLQVPQSALLEVIFDTVTPSDPNEEECILNYRCCNEQARMFLLLISRAFSTNAITQATEVKSNVSIKERGRK